MCDGSNPHETTMEAGLFFLYCVTSDLWFLNLLYQPKSDVGRVQKTLNQSILLIKRSFCVKRSFFEHVSNCYVKTNASMRSLHKILRNLSERCLSSGSLSV
jgi:hypothetical protein